MLVFKDIIAMTKRSTPINQFQTRLGYSLKGPPGHLLEATGAIEMVANILAIKHQIIPPILNFLEKDPGCNLPLVTNYPKASFIENAIVVLRAPI